MYEKINDNVTAALAANSKIRENILEEFLLTINKLNEHLKQLLKAGIDQERHLCLRSSNGKLDGPCNYTFLDETMVSAFQGILEKLIKSKKDGPKKFSFYLTGPYSKLFVEYSEISTLLILSRLYAHAGLAQQELAQIRDKLLPFNE